MTMDTIVAFDTDVGFVILSVALLMSSTVMWRKEHFWNLVYSTEYIFPLFIKESLAVQFKILWRYAYNPQ
jgi:hypothetical protein